MKNLWKLFFGGVCSAVGVAWLALCYSCYLEAQWYQLRHTPEYQAWVTERYQTMQMVWQGIPEHQWPDSQCILGPIVAVGGMFALGLFIGWLLWSQEEMDEC